MAEPDVKLSWATTDIVEQYDLGKGDGLQAYPNKYLPPDQIQSSGISVREKWPRVFLNYIFNNIFLWIDHLDNRYIIGDLHITTTAEDATAISTRLGGTWTLSGTDTIGTESVNVFKKTA